MGTGLDLFSPQGSSDSGGSAAEAIHTDEVDRRQGRARDPRLYNGHIVSFLSHGFRPFFLAASLWAIAAIALWITMLTAGVLPPSGFPPLLWHIHAMVFGFVPAAVAGFLLTAIPNWTGRPPVRGMLLALLAELWLIGRIASLVSADIPAWLAILADAAFLFALAVVVARELIASRNRRNYPMIAPVAVLAIANLMMDLTLAGYSNLGGYGWRLGLAAILILLSVVGGRIVPAFTRNWLMARKVEPLPPPPGWANRLSLGLLHAALIAWVFLPTARPMGWVLLVAGILNLWRLARWQAGATRSEPLLLILHIGYGWLALGVAFLGLTLILPAVPTSAAIHALTVGTIGTMILAVMTRVTRGHTGNPLSADAFTTAIYVLVSLAAAARIGAEFAQTAYLAWLHVAAAAWIAAFGLFALRYAPLLVRARRS